GRSPCSLVCSPFRFDDPCCDYKRPPRSWCRQDRLPAHSSFFPNLDSCRRRPACHPSQACRSARFFSAFVFAALDSFRSRATCAHDRHQARKPAAKKSASKKPAAKISSSSASSSSAAPPAPPSSSATAAAASSSPAAGASPSRASAHLHVGQRGHGLLGLQVGLHSVRHLVTTLRRPF
ncbi:unnamed protein product, partial [Pylaiella littoralis]